MGSFDNGVNERERIAFELGIKLGTLFHQFIGTPVSTKNKTSLEDSIEKSIRNQPFVKIVNVNINCVEDNYSSLSPDQLSARVIVEYDGYRAEGKLEYKENYPLMWIEELEKK